MERNKAIFIIAQEELGGMSKEERESELLNMWGIDDEDPEFAMLPDSLQEEILHNNGPVADVMSPRYDPLLMEALKKEYVGVKNAYLSEQVSRILGEEIVVEGQEDRLFACPCCMYRTLTERGQYDICPVCFWEDDGNDKLGHYSGPNHMTLAEGRDHFVQYGAVTPSALKYIKPDAKKRYYFGGGDL
ncbi:CPCC family cysteine-rich protein [Kroppenstedtia eburnea]|uniref:CPCC family cysteine-rich protein n=1 Tax=Kroppenstedtia eburnea TaxID=714067 RepID=UPI0036329423